ncbi:MAG TPA: MerR family transcriptional regulator [Polyangiaceae bacterium]|nr:MerR family transcriptional regulator [Polyangiaceae bacterium]
MSLPHELVKLYYRIGEVSHIVGVQPHVLRYWESEFRSIRPQKSHKGQRVYSRRDVERLLKVKDLLKNQGFTIAGAKKKLREPGAPPIESRPPEKSAQMKTREALVGIREDIVRMLDELDTPPRRLKLPQVP